MCDVIHPKLTCLSQMMVVGQGRLWGDSMRNLKRIIKIYFNCGYSKKVVLIILQLKDFVFNCETKKLLSPILNSEKLQKRHPIKPL